MGVCSQCRRLNPVSICTGDLTIGTVSSVNTVYNIFFKSLSNGFVVKYSAISSSAGLLTLAPTDGFILATNHLYEMYVNKTNSTSDGESLTIGTVTATCYNVLFENVLEGSTNTIYTYVHQTLEIA